MKEIGFLTGYMEKKALMGKAKFNNYLFNTPIPPKVFDAIGAAVKPNEELIARTLSPDNPAAFKVMSKIAPFVKGKSINEGIPAYLRSLSPDEIKMLESDLKPFDSKAIKAIVENKATPYSILTPENATGRIKYRQQLKEDMAKMPPEQAKAFEASMREGAAREKVFRRAVLEGDAEALKSMIREAVIGQ